MREQERSEDHTRRRAIKDQVRTMYHRSLAGLFAGLYSVIQEGGMTYEEALEGLDASVSEQAATDFEHWYPKP